MTLTSYDPRRGLPYRPRAGPRCGGGRRAAALPVGAEPGAAARGGGSSGGCGGWRQAPVRGRGRQHGQGRRRGPTTPRPRRFMIGAGGCPPHDLSGSDLPIVRPRPGTCPAAARQLSGARYGPCQCPPVAAASGRGGGGTAARPLARPVPTGGDSDAARRGAHTGRRRRRPLGRKGWPTLACPRRPGSSLRVARARRLHRRFKNTNKMLSTRLLRSSARSTQRLDPEVTSRQIPVCSHSLFSAAISPLLVLTPTFSQIRSSMDQLSLGDEKKEASSTHAATDRKDKSAPNPKAVIHSAKVAENRTKNENRPNLPNSAARKNTQKSNAVVMNARASSPIFFSN